MTTTTTTDLLPQAGATPPWDAALDRPEWQRIWLGAQSRPWRSLAVVAGGDGLSTQEVARLLVALGLHHGEQIGYADVRDTGLNGIGALIDLAAFHAARGERFVFATRTVRENLATIPLARTADAAILCVALGATQISLVEETLDQIGKNLFLGSMLVPEPKGGQLAMPPELEPRRLPGRS